MIDGLYVVGVIAGMGAVTFALRALPFVAAHWLESHPLVRKLSLFLPLAIMALLLMHSLADAARQDPAGPWPEGVSIALVLLLQWLRRNALLSILAGSVVYVVLRNSGLA